MRPTRDSWHGHRIDAGGNDVHPRPGYRTGAWCGEEYLAAAWRAIDEEFGSLVAYLRDSGITEDDVARLRGEPLS
jgi:Tyrosine phosphatase family